MTVRVHLVRHAKAKNRAGWTEPDALRPLTKRGRREAAALAELLRASAPARLVSSPFVRCVQTFEPLAEALDIAIETTELLAEGADGGGALDLLLSLSRGGSVGCCTHGDVLYAVKANPAPWVIRDPVSEAPEVIGVLGGHLGGGNNPNVSYAAYFGVDIEALYARAVKTL